MDGNRTARWLIRAGIVAMAYALAVALAFVAFGDGMPRGWALPAPLIALALFAAAHLATSEQREKTAARAWPGFAMIFWVLRNIPHWAKLVWAGTLIAFPVLLSAMPAGRRELVNQDALHLTFPGFYFALSSTLIVWAKIREQRSDAAQTTQE